MIDSKKEPVFNAEKLKDLRLNKNMSCYELAALSGIHRKDIHLLEKKTVKHPTFNTVARLAFALGVSTDTFINEMSL